MLSISTEDKLQERIKELKCLYDISSAILNHSNSIKDTLYRICIILKQAWRFPEKATVELNLPEYYILIGTLPAKTVFQNQNVSVLEKCEGFIKVHYPGDKFTFGDFLIDEEKLLHKVASDIGTFLEKQLSKDKEELLKRSAERVDRLSILGEITAGIAHELNTPLGNILGFAELITERTQEKQTKLDSLKIINAAIYSREVVKKLMFFSCEMPQNMEFVKIEPIVSQALSLLGPNFSKAKVSFELEFDNPTLVAQLDTIQLTQVLFNILINSIYVSPKNSRIKVKVYNTETLFFIEIADEGPGIQEDIKAKIFEPFFTTKPIGEGSGLGLSVVHGIVKSHKGDIITFDNQPHGTVFQIQLPLTMKK
jgi:signal transduction histidine kinase